MATRMVCAAKVVIGCGSGSPKRRRGAWPEALMPRGRHSAQRGGWPAAGCRTTDCLIHGRFVTKSVGISTPLRRFGTWWATGSTPSRLLATVRQNPAKCPEGDALEHSLQVFDLVHRERPFDEELLTAALVHDVGRAIDRSDPVAATVEAVGDLLTDRTKWLVEMLPAARGHVEQTIGHRARKRLEAHPDFLDVILLAEADRRAHQRGYPAPSLDEAIAILRALEREA